MRIFLGMFLVLASAQSWAKEKGCFPVPFDHFWFRVDKDSYQKMGASTYFADERFSYFEPNKKPWGTHYGHYVTGNLHHLEIFDEDMPTRSEPIGIGFQSEKAGCLAEIHARLNKLGRPFTMQPDADWGRFTEAQKNDSLAVWVAEMKPAYVGAPDGAVDRAAWIRRMKKMNGDPSDGQHNFERVREVVWRLEKKDAEFLGKVLKTLGWRKASGRTYELDHTRVMLETARVSATQSLRSLTLELRRPYKGIDLGAFQSEASEDPPRVRFHLREVK